MRKLYMIGVAAVLCGCSYPQSQLQQGAENGQLSFPNVPEGSRISIDGQDAGMGSSFDRQQVLSVRPGTHRVVLTNGSATILDKKYYVGAGAKVAVKND
jgi:hypothetical protein